MTVLQLFSYISLAILLQVAVFGALAFFRHWLAYQGLKRRLTGFDAGLPEEAGREEASLFGVPGQMASWEGFRDFRVVRKVFEDESRSVCSFHLVPKDGKPLADFSPGQFLTFRLDVADPDTGGRKTIVRCYSLSDRPGLDHYRISVKRVPPPADAPDLPPGLSSNHFHDNVRDGDVLAVRAPSGHFFLEAGNDPVVLIAGGIGITPILSMLNTSLQNGSKREIWLFYGVRNSAEHVMKDRLDALAEAPPNFRPHVCYSRPLPGDVLDTDYQHEGHVDIALLRLTLSLKPYQFYVCGPTAMLESLVPALDEWGVSEQHIHYEAFGPASLAGPTARRPAAAEETTAARPITVNFSRSGNALTWDESAGSLLEFAERNGVRVASGCRAGACGSCQTIIEEGEVEYVQAPDFDPDPGSCLLCISRPVRDLTLLA